MKKAILSLALFFAFTGYILYSRIVGANNPVVFTPDPNKITAPIVLPDNTQNQNPPVASNPNNQQIPPPVIDPPVQTGKYKNGSYTGNVVNAYYGYVQVLAVISGGKITDVQFLNHPKDRQTSIYINNRAMPYLTSEAITAQDSNVDTVSGASFTSAAFKKSLASALVKARV